MPAQRNLHERLEQQRQTHEHNNQRNVLPFIFVVSKDAKANHGGKPEELVVTVRHVEKA